jgi:hypothetical protein
LLVLEGSTSTLQRSNNLKLIVEVHTFSNEIEIIEWLEKHGYQVRFLEPKNKIYHIIATRKKGV